MKQSGELPKVSIIIPVYNGADYLDKAIQSALNQSYQNVEIIVVNDGSNDGGKTAEIARSHGDKIRYIEKENGGVSSALNRGIEAMTGEYFSWLSHDDEYRNEKIEKQVDALRAFKNDRVIALCDTEFIDEGSRVLDKSWGTPPSGVYNSEQTLLLMNKKPLSGISLLIPKAAFLECGGFDTTLRFTQDADMWERIFLNGYSLLVDKTIYARSRLHGKQQTNTHRERFREESDRTIPVFCDKLCEKGLYSVAQALLLKLYRTDLIHSAQYVETKLREQGQLPLTVQLKAKANRAYGKIRPFIRQAYYKLKFGIDSKDSKG